MTPRASLQQSVPMTPLSAVPVRQLNLPNGGTLELLSHVLSLLPNPVYVKDRQHLWVEANPAFCDILGRTREDLLGKSDYDISPPDQADVFWAMDDDVFLTQGQNINHEALNNAVGETLWVESQKSYFKTEDGAEYLVGILTDLTALVDIQARETALAAAEGKALASARAKSEFLANMSHEIRTPMNGVLGMTQLLRGTGLTDQQTEMVDMLERTGDALLSLIDDVLDFSKIEAGRLKLSPEPFDLRQMVDDVVVLLGSSARESELDLIVQFAPSLPCYVVGDRGRIRQVLLNLIGNAIKFTENGYISVEVDGRVEAGGLHLSASVCDTGIGIAEDKLASIFEKFEQADGSMTRIYGGTGLGLAISRDLVTLMGGTLTATSVLGTGSRFRMDVNLPIVANEPSSQTDADINPDIKGLKILVVDDLPPNLKVITTQLERLGLCADAVGSAKAAVEHLVTASQSGDPYTLLITDYHMPDCDGLRLTQTLRRHESFKALDIIAMSSVSEGSVRESFAAAKVNDYLFKPITLANFDRMIMRSAARLRGDAP
ncbi:hypothetical protein GCM10009069_23190 [Algimonas arctica]|uniref:histidine kinase n=1 Tax=Algimonas arctica TaxID=1479486 RepID=A0A8J3CTZ8_9PROT|nr:ATP-binding protein [Algimonas arctica]GHA99738.1 hypothetical protein GCM10009069_23190 [Algimonas arctica]